MLNAFILKPVCRQSAVSTEDRITQSVSLGHWSIPFSTDGVVMENLFGALMEMPNIIPINIYTPTMNINETAFVIEG